MYANLRRVLDLERSFTAGTYTVILSAFETTHVGAFNLKVESDAHANLDPIPPEGAGMFHKFLRGEW